MNRQPHVVVLVGGEPTVPAAGVDPHARQLLRWFEDLPVDARFEVHDLARRRHARLARPSFEVLTVDPRTVLPGAGDASPHS